MGVQQLLITVGASALFFWSINSSAYRAPANGFAHRALSSNDASPASIEVPTESDAYLATAVIDGPQYPFDGGMRIASTFGTPWLPTSSAHINHGLEKRIILAQAAAAAQSEPVIGSNAQPTAVNAAASAPTTTDGTCGSANGGTVCGNWPKGSCCSQYGWCGNTPHHCGDGCQSGPCANGATTQPSGQAPGAKPAGVDSNPGQFIVYGQSGVPAMHGGILANDHVFFLDKVENYTQVQLPDGQFAYSVEYDPVTATYVPLSYKTNAFCSGGAYLADGTVISVGGNGPLTWLDPTVSDGFDAIRYLTRAPGGSQNGQSWVENSNKLNSKRWYASAQVLHDGEVFVCSGSLNGLDPAVNDNNNPTFEMLNAQGQSISGSTTMDILVKAQPYYMYPFLALLPNGYIFILVSKSCQIFDPKGNKIVTELPDIPGLQRTYPNTGGGQLLALSSKNNWQPSFIVCGGGAYQDITSPTDPSCGRISPLAQNPQWEMDAMPYGRVMGEFQLLPNGMLLLLNGAGQGSQGFGLATNPTLQALLYDPNEALGQRFSTLASSTIPRLYHSICILLSNGSVLVTGSGPNEMPVLQPDATHPFVTEFRVEIYNPPYTGDLSQRASRVAVSTANLQANGMQFTVTFMTPQPPKNVIVSLMYPSFNTHSLHMGERGILLDFTFTAAAGQAQTLTATMPPNSDITPPGPARVYIFTDGVPADAAAYVIVS